MDLEQLALAGTGIDFPATMVRKSPLFLTWGQPCIGEASGTHLLHRFDCEILLFRPLQAHRRQPANWQGDWLQKGCGHRQREGRKSRSPHQQGGDQTSIKVQPRAAET